VTRIPAALAVAALWAAPAAHATCNVATVGGGPPSEEEAACGPINPPQSSAGDNIPPLIVTWASGYDINPVGGFRGGIYIATLSGDGRRKITSFQHHNRDFAPHGLNLPDDHPSFSPDNRRIVFTSNRANPNDWDIHVMNVNGTGMQRLAPAPGLDTEPVFSPDGKRILFSTERFNGTLDIAVMNVDGTNLLRYTSGPQDEIEPAWSPDGQLIAFTRSQSVDNKDIFLINVDGTNQRQLTFTPGEDHDATFSPNGQELAITSERNGSPPYGNVHHISVADGTDLGDLTADLATGAGDPFWSKSNHIAFFHSLGPNIRSPQRLFVMNANGTGKTHIPGETPVNVHPAIGAGIDGNGNGVPDYLDSGSVGKASLSPRTVAAGRTAVVRFGWRHPERWRRLDTLYLSLDDGQKVVGIVRVIVGDPSFALYDPVARQYGTQRLLRSGRVLKAGGVSLDLRRTRFVNVDRKRLRLDLALRLPRGRFHVSVQADDLRARNQNERLGTLVAR